MRARTPEEIGRAAREARKRHGLGQWDVALAAGTGRRFVVDLESGKGTVQLAQTLRVLEALGLSVELNPFNEKVVASDAAEEEPVSVERRGGNTLNEAFCLWLAGRLGLHVPRAELVVQDEEWTLEVERSGYDRVELQGPGLAECIEQIRRACDCPAREVARFLNGVFLNLLIGNCEAGPKSYALLQAPQEPYVSLAPLHGLRCTAIEPDGPAGLPMSIGGERSPDRIDADAIRALAEEACLGPAALRELVRELALRARMGAKDLAEAFKYERIEGEGEVADEIAATVSENATRLLRSLASSGTRT